MRLDLVALTALGFLFACGNNASRGSSSPPDDGLAASASGSDAGDSSSGGTAESASGGATGGDREIGGSSRGGNVSAAGAGSPPSSSEGGASAGFGGTMTADSGTGSGGMATGGTGSPARGAVSLHVLAPSGCSLDEHFQDFPTLAGGHPVDETAVSSTVENGQMSSTGEPIFVLCTWGANEPPFTVDGLIRIGVSGTAGERRIEVTSTMAEGQVFNGNLVVRTAELPIGYDVGDAGPCVFTTLGMDPNKRSVWGRFSCGGLDASDGMDHCAAGPSFFYFENCALR